MPELKHHFRKGRMNKDLDERLLPNGEYRDAQNIEIATSDGSNVGTVQNVIGTSLKKGKSYNPQTKVLSNWTADSNYFDLHNPFCVGHIVDTQNDKVYWFITYSYTSSDSSTITKASAILEYNDITNEIQPVLVDIKNILNFSEENLITGINIIDGLLLWTDGITEPKKINIKTFKAGCVNDGATQFETHTKYPVTSTTVDNFSLSNFSDFIESDITAIRLSPNYAPNISFSSSKRSGLGTTVSPLVSSMPSFTTTGNSDTVNLTAGTIVEINLNEVPDFRINDRLKLKTTIEDDINGDKSYEIIVAIDTEFNSFRRINAKIQSIPDEVPFGVLNWDVSLEEDEPLFENKFVRFSYRWKYLDGEYSTLAPFSQIAFLPSKFKYEAADGYNVGMINTTRVLTINSIESVSNAVVEVELLYKESNSENIFVVDRIKAEDIATKFPYSITNEIVGDIIESNQILRPWDAIPLSAKSQEISSNRVLYANYKQGYNIDNTRLPDIFTKVLSSKIPTIGNPEKSVKSQRTYQTGVVYLDKYGRETPVFTNKDAAIKIQKQDADKKNSIQCRLKNLAPAFATHFKYFIKESSSEYYNLALDRFYLAEDGNVWLSFPSSERNKITKESYIFLKKQHDKDTFVSQDAKYKVLDISNEVPSYISEEVLSLCVGTVRSLYSGGLNNEPRVKSISFQFLGPTDVENPTFYRSFNSENSITLTTSAGITKKYDIKKGGATGKKDGDFEIYEVELKQSFDEAESDTLLGTNSSLGTTSVFLNSAGNGGEEYNIHIFGKTIKNKSEFFGRFFAKINRDTLFDNAIVETFPSTVTEYVIVRDQEIIQSARSDPQGDKKNNKSDWCWTDTKATAYSSASPVRHPELGGNEFTIYLAGVDLPGEKNTSHKPDFSISSFEKEITKAGSIIQFQNEAGEVGSHYKITSATIAYKYRHKKKARKKRTAGKRRNYTIKFEQVDGLVKTYDDDFLYNITGADEPKGRITQINILRKLVSTDSLEENDISSDNPAIFETEPIEAVEVDIYNEVSSAIPIIKTGLKVTALAGETGIADNTIIDFYSPSKNKIILLPRNDGSLTAGQVLTMTAADDSYSFNIKIGATGYSANAASIIIADNQVHGQQHTLDFFNCYSFGQGVESNRLRDDFNAVTIDKGPIVSTVLNEKYKQELKPSSIIYSGIFNSTGGVNRLNQFIAAEKITKDLNPEYGSIQKLHVRDTDIIAFCEDKVLKILANKDALYNADGNPNLLSTNRVLGQAVPYLGEFGISKNPESFISHAYRLYFSDKARGAILRLSRDGITEVSSKGMTDWFNDNVPVSNSIVGSYDERKGSYNITLNNYTLSFDERVDGWTSFKSFVPEAGFSLNNNYFTFKYGRLYCHNNERRNSFHQHSCVEALNGTSSGTTLYLGTQPSVANIKVGDYIIDEAVNEDVTVSAITVPMIPVFNESASFVGTGSTIAFTILPSSGFTVIPSIQKEVEVYIDGILINKGNYRYNNTNLTDDVPDLPHTYVLQFNNSSVNSTLQESDGSPKSGKKIIIGRAGEEQLVPNKALSTQITLSSSITIGNSANLEIITTDNSSVTLLINDQPSIVKEYKTISYEGSGSRYYTYSGTITKNAAGQSLSSNIIIAAGTTLDKLKKSGYNSNQIKELTTSYVKGWTGESVKTNIQSGNVLSFKEKEGLWSNFITGDVTSSTNIDTKELSVQGLGTFAAMTGDTTISEKKVTVSMTNVSSDHNTIVGDPKILYGESGDAIGNVQLTIKPVLGYRIFAYQMGFTLLTGANAVTFEQDGKNVIATFVFPGNNPGYDISYAQSITGVAIPIYYSVAGFYSTHETNTTTDSKDLIPYKNNHGIYNTTSSLVLLKTFTAEANHVFNTANSISAIIEQQDDNDISGYDITNNWATTTKDVGSSGSSNSTSVGLTGYNSAIAVGMSVTGVGLGQDARVVSHQINGNLVLNSAKTIPAGTTLTFKSAVVSVYVKYVFGTNNPIQDFITLTANATEVFNPAISELTSFVGTNSTISNYGESRTMIVKGSTGYVDEANPFFTFSNEVSGSSSTFTQSGSTATATFTNLTATPRPGMSVIGSTLTGATVDFISVNSLNGAITVHVTLSSSSSISAPSGLITFKQYWNGASFVGDRSVASETVLTLPESGRYPINVTYDQSSTTNSFNYFIRPVIVASDNSLTTGVLSSSFSGSVTNTDVNFTYANFLVTQYKLPTISIAATNTASTEATNTDTSNYVKIRNLTDAAAVNSSGHLLGTKDIVLSAVNSEIKPGMVVVSGNNIPSLTRVTNVVSDGSNTTISIDKIPQNSSGANQTLGNGDEITFIDNGQYHAYGEPKPGSSASEIFFRVIVKAEGTARLSKIPNVLPITSADLKPTEYEGSVASYTTSTNTFTLLSNLDTNVAVGMLVSSSSFEDTYIITSIDHSNNKFVVSSSGLDGSNPDDFASSFVNSEITMNASLSANDPLWDFDFEDLTESITDNAAGDMVANQYTLQGSLSVSKYGINDLSIPINLNSVLTTSIGGANNTAAVPLTAIFIQKTFITSYHITAFTFLPKSVAVGASANSQISGSGNITGVFYGNTISMIGLELGAATQGFNTTINSFAFTSTFSGTSGNQSRTLSYNATFTLSTEVTASSVLRLNPQITLQIQP